MKNIKFVRWSAWLIVSFFYAYQYILRVMPSVLMEDIVKKFSLSPEAFGQFSGIYYLGYSLIHLPVGIVLDRFGPKRVLPLLIASTSLGLLPILYAESFIYPILGRLLIGIGSSGAILGVFKVLHLYFEPLKFSRFLSFSVTIGLLGAIYGGAPIHIARTIFGFETIVFVLLSVSAVLAVLSYFILPEAKDEQRSQSVVHSLKTLFANRNLILLCLASGLMVGPLEGFADVWGVQFLKVFHGISDSIASGIPSWIFLGMCFGGPILSFIAEKTGKLLVVVLTAGVLMALAFFLLIAVPLSATTLSIMFFVVGICSAYQILMIYQASTYVASEHKTLASVLANMMIMIFGYVFHTSIGESIGFLAKRKGVEGFHDAGILAEGISIIPIASTVGLLLILLYFAMNRRASLGARR